MIVGRREFLWLLGAGAGAATLGCARGQWSVPDRLVELALRGPGLETFVHTACGLCSGACGLTVRLIDDLPVGVKGNPRHPLSRGGLCPVGMAALDILYAPDRLQGPLRRGADGAHHPVEWEKALGEITERIQRLDGSRRGEQIAFLVGEGGALQRELIGQFAAALGGPNVMGPTDGAALGAFLTQGIPERPAYDFAHSDLVLSFGLDLFEDGDAPIHATAALVGSRPTDKRAGLVHVGTRLSPSAAKARPHVPVLPGTHGAFALGVAHFLVREGSFDRAFVAERTFGFDDWTDEKGRGRMGFRRLLLERYYPDRVAKLCGCEPAQIGAVARRFAKAAAPVAIAGGEAVCGSNATVTVVAVHALNALVGAFDRPGGVVLPPPIPFTPLAAPPQHTTAPAP
jgi:anaerobic selenocysteine-containing dehydrogenase